MIRILLLFIVVFGPFAEIRAEVLGSYDLRQEIHSQGISNRVDFDMGYEFEDDLKGIERFKIFDDLFLDSGDIGKEFVITEDDSGFSDFVSFLSNNENEILLFEYHLEPDGESNIDLSRESFFLFGDSGSSDVFDLFGFRITSIELAVNSINFDSPGRNPNGDGNWTDFTADFTLTINGKPGVSYW